jgi:hypothetical protein
LRIDIANVVRQQTSVPLNLPHFISGFDVASLQ